MTFSLITNFLISRRTTTALIVVMLVSGVVHSMLIGGSPKLPPLVSFLALLNQAILAVTSLLTLFSLLFSLKRMLRKAVPVVSSSEKIPLGIVASEVFPTLADFIHARMTKQGYRSFVQSQGFPVFQKDGIGRLGLAVFHIGLLVIVAAFLYRGTFGQRGVINLLPGDRIMIKDADWTSRDMGLFARSFNTDFIFGFDSIDPTFLEGKLHDLKSRVLVQTAEGAREASISFQFPISVNGTSIYQTDKQGPVVTVAIARRGKQELTHFLLHAPMVAGDATGDGDFPTTPYYFTITLPSGAREAVVHIRRGTETLYHGKLKEGEPLPLGEDTIAITRISRWSGFMFTARQGTYGFYAGVLLAIVGAVMYYLLFPRQVRFTFEEQDEMVSVSVSVSVVFASLTAAPFPVGEQEQICNEIGEMIRSRPT